MPAHISMQGVGSQQYSSDAQVNIKLNMEKTCV